MKISKNLTRFSLILNGIFILLFVVVFVFAVVQRMEAQNRKMEAESCMLELNKEKEKSEAQRLIAEKLKEQAIMAQREAELARQKVEEARLNKD